MSQEWIDTFKIARMVEAEWAKYLKAQRLANQRDFKGYTPGASHKDAPASEGIGYSPDDLAGLYDTGHVTEERGRIMRAIACASKTVPWRRQA